MNPRVVLFSGPAQANHLQTTAGRETPGQSDRGLGASFAEARGILINPVGGCVASYPMFRLLRDDLLALLTIAEPVCWKREPLVGTQHNQCIRKWGTGFLFVRSYL